MSQNITTIKKAPLSVGLLAHVDAGKTTLSEALLYCAGARRVLGRVDHADTLLDTHALERQRGITIFSKQARLETADFRITLVDTPGHVDFSPEAERTLPVLDCAVLVISGTDGIQAHTHTLWKLLQRYSVPTFLFINKMDLAGADKSALMESLQAFDPGCVDFTQEFSQIAEAAALCDEALLENFLESGTLTEANLRGLIEKRKLFPCIFGSALKNQGVDLLLEVLNTYAPRPDYPAEFGGLVYKISRDALGSRLTWLKVTGGVLNVRSSLSYDGLSEKITQLRLYSGEKFQAVEAAYSGDLVAVTGLTATKAGQQLGTTEKSLTPVLEPVITCRIGLPAGTDLAVVLPKLRQLEEEEPQLHLFVQGNTVQVQLMGTVQAEIFRALVQERFGLDISLNDRQIFYKETIAAPVEGVGHFEPLRHYAEVHLLLEPLPRGTGLVLDTVCPTDVLDAGYQSLILTHLGEKIHRGVLTGAPITDVKLTLLVGKAHLKHTEGGDFRQATYRAVRQGLMQTQSVLLEPWYEFAVTVPTAQIGRVITDIRYMGGRFDAPESQGNFSVLKGLVPAGEVKDYAQTLAAFTQGRGSLQLSLHGYDTCHNAEEVIAQAAYNPEADLENTPDSVFCAHGGGFTVKWNQVSEYMHLESGLKEEKPPQLVQRQAIDDRELEAIMEREFGPIKRPQFTAPKREAATAEVTIRTPRQKYIIVDGYNMIFAWETLAETAKTDLDAARRQLCDALISYAGFTKCRMVVVFDGYKRKGSPGEKVQEKTIQIVYTPEGQTADRYIEELAAEIGSSYAVYVASSDSLVQLSSFRSGVLRMSARELFEEVERVRKEMKVYFSVQDRV